jgi:hypothetical protein
MERRQFTREFKLEAVRLIKERGVSYAQASADLGVHPTQLRNWVKQLGPRSGKEFALTRKLYGPMRWPLRLSSTRWHMREVMSGSWTTLKPSMRGEYKCLTNPSIAPPRR